MSTQTLNAPQVTAPAKRSRNRQTESTPHSMQVPSGQAAASSPKSLDLIALVASIAKVKAAIGSKSVGHKGKQNLFSLVCKAWKSHNGKGVDERVPDAVEADIRKAVNAFWLNEATKMVTQYGEVVSVQWDSPKAKVVDTESGRKDVNLQWNATLKARRESKDDAEFRLGLSFEVTKAQKRLDYMKDHPEKGYTREDIQAQNDLLTVLESKQLDMNQKRDAIVELEKRRTANTITPDEYQAELKKLIVVQPAS
jgi:hypothetical protein